MTDKSKDLTKSETSTDITVKEVEACVLPLRGHRVIVDSEVAMLYGVETRRVNEAVKNNPDKFPNGYIFELTEEEIHDVNALIASSNEFAVEKFDRKTISTKSRYAPKAFTEQGLYMLATILKSQRATKTTLAIIDTYAKYKELSRGIEKLQTVTDPTEKKSLVEQTGRLLNELLLPNNVIKKNDVQISLNMMSVTIQLDKKNK